MIDHSNCNHPGTKSARAACRQGKSADYVKSPDHDFLVWTQDLALSLMTQHGLIDDGWRFQWDRAQRRFGRCSWSHKVISLSRVLTPVCTPEEVKNTILHEIAHVLVGFRRGDAHGYEWQEMAIKIGARAERCMSTADKQLPKANYILKCPNCKREWHRYRKSKNFTRKVACTPCCRMYNNGVYSDQFQLEIITL